MVKSELRLFQALKSWSHTILTDKIISVSDWARILADCKTTKNGTSSDKLNVVFTNGCFDILHAGHVQYLESAKELGDIMIIGLNSDASVRRLKGNSRPINTQQDRAIVMAALSSVDYIIIFDEDTPYSLIQIVQPDILVKGGDWEVDLIVGNEIVLSKGGKVLSLPFWEGLSTTKILEKMSKD